MDTLITATKTILPLLGVAVVVGLLFAGCSHRKMCDSRRDWAENPAKLEAMATKHANEMLDEVEASEDQRTRVHAIQDRLLTDVLALGQEKRTVHDAIRVAWRSDQVDTARLHDLVDGKSESMKDLGHSVVETLAELHGVFTPEQRNRISRKIETHCRR